MDTEVAVMEAVVLYVGGRVEDITTTTVALKYMYCTP